MFNLKFTGNWYIDLGILGLKILFDETRKISDKINLRLDNKDNFIKSFLVVYLTKVIGDQVRNNLGRKSKEEEYKEFLDLLYDTKKEYFEKIFSNGLDRKNVEEIVESVFKKFQRHLVDEVINRKLPSEKKKNERESYEQFVKKQRNKNRLWLDSNFYKNFSFFNPSAEIDKQIESIKKFFKNGEIIERDGKVIKVEFFKTLNKFLPSYGEFPNNFFVSTSLNDIVAQMNFQDYIFYASILSIPYAFVNIRGVNYAFYSPDEEFSFTVNLRLKKYLEREEEKKDNEILKITWRSIIDVLLEQKSEWSLNNMYLISYKRIRNEGVEGVEYIGIDKQKARIVIDDEFREKLNTVLQYSRAKTNKNKQLIRKWLLWEYLENNSLFDICWEYVKYSIENNNLYLEPIFYALMIEANSKRYNKVNNGCSAFDYILHHSLPDNSLIKEGIRETKRANDNFNKIKSIERHIYYLLLQLKERKKSSFVNNLLKIINSSEIDDYTKRSLIDYIFNRILYNNSSSWKHYGLALILPQKNGK